MFVMDIFWLFCLQTCFGSEYSDPGHSALQLLVELYDRLTMHPSHTCVELAPVDVHIHSDAHLSLNNLQIDGNALPSGATDSHCGPDSSQ